jgi:hypothetical protein
MNNYLTYELFIHPQLWEDIRSGKFDGDIARVINNDSHTGYEFTAESVEIRVFKVDETVDGYYEAVDESIDNSLLEYADIDELSKAIIAYVS